ncbi:hypothetical protein EQH57_0267 [Dictyocoela roeselum]|nr:hypothetical protein EQH57_0267 [Dictyocoela roeselum]
MFESDDDCEYEINKEDLSFTYDGWSDSLQKTKPDMFNGVCRLLIDMPTTEEGFFESLFHDSIIDYILKLTNKKIKEKEIKDNDSRYTSESQSNIKKKTIPGLLYKRLLLLFKLFI